MVTVAPGSTPPDASVTVPRSVAVPCAAAVPGVPSANTATSAAHAKPRISVLNLLPSCTGFSPQKVDVAKPNLIRRAEYHKGTTGVSRRKTLDFLHFGGIYPQNLRPAATS